MKLKEKLRKICLVILSVSLFACFSSTTESDPKVKGSVKFSAQEKSFTNLAILSSSYSEEELPAKVVITYSTKGSSTEHSVSFFLTTFGNGYITDDVVSLEPGDYVLTKFDVLNATGVTIYSTPMEGSIVANSAKVQTALGYEFSVAEGSVATVNMQVLKVEEDTNPADFGFASFTFEVVDYNKFYIDVMALGEDEHWESVNANLKVQDGSGNVKVETELYSAINRIFVDKCNDYKLIISKEGFATQEFSLSSAELAEYGDRSQPLKVRLSKIDDGFHTAQWFLVDGEEGVRRRSAWWDSQEDQWKKAFNSDLQDTFSTGKPSDQEIKSIFTDLYGSFGSCELTNLSGIKNLTNLKGLDIYYNSITSLSGIENLANLEHFDITCNELTSLKELKNLTNITNLSCSKNRLYDLQGIEQLTNLEYLYCYGNYIENLSEVANLTKLKALWCFDNHLTSLHGIENLNCLSNLWCSGNKLTNLKEIENLTTLRELKCYGNNLADLQSLKNLVNLEVLYCNNSNLSSLSGIENLVKMREMAFSSNQITSMQEIKDFVYLKRLWCGDNPLISLQGIEKFNMLEDLYAQDCYITSLQPVKDLVSLKTLFCWNNSLSNLQGVENLTNLSRLVSYKNIIPQEEVDRVADLLPNCSVCNISHNE